MIDYEDKVNNIKGYTLVLLDHQFLQLNRDDGAKHELSFTYVVYIHMVHFVHVMKRM